MPVNVNVLDMVAVLPLAIVNVALDAGAVMVTLLIVVAVALPNVGEIKVGDVSNTKLFVPVTPVKVCPSMVA